MSNGAPTPDCPGCGSAPLFLLGGDRAAGATQAFCPADACPVVTWNPQLGPDQIGAAHGVDLSALTDGSGRTVMLNPGGAAVIDGQLAEDG